jgi:hypothetical protein
VAFLEKVLRGGEGRGGGEERGGWVGQYCFTLQGAVAYNPPFPSHGRFGQPNSLDTLHAPAACSCMLGLYPPPPS